MSVAAAVASTRSLRLNREAPAQIDAIILIGSTCTGKTTLANAIRSAALPGIDVPRRFVTRAPRPGDTLEEATHLSSIELDAAIAAGMVQLHWSRTLEQGHVERYGFAAPRPGLLPFYSANNAICQLALPNALTIGALAPDDVRESRLRARSPELVRDRPAEARARLAEAADAIVPFAHVLVDNAGELEAITPAELVALVRHIATQHA
jgi:ribose 1,5-bisphosphokinase PhnN